LFFQLNGFVSSARGVCLDDEEKSKREPTTKFKTLSAPLFHEIVEAVARELAVLELLQLARVVWLLTVWG